MLCKHEEPKPELESSSNHVKSHAWLCMLITPVLGNRDGWILRAHCLTSLDKEESLQVCDRLSQSNRHRVMGDNLFCPLNVQSIGSCTCTLLCMKHTHTHKSLIEAMNHTIAWVGIAESRETGCHGMHSLVCQSLAHDTTESWHVLTANGQSSLENSFPLRNTKLLFLFTAERILVDHLT